MGWGTDRRQGNCRGMSPRLARWRALPSLILLNDATHVSRVLPTNHILRTAQVSIGHLCALPTATGNPDHA